MSALRQEKIARLIQRDLSEIFQRESKAMGLNKMISVTVVRVSQDLGSAKAYLSIFPNENAQGTLNEVKNNISLIRAKLAGRVKNQLRKLPELHFYIDDSFDYSQKIDDLLKK